MKPFFRSLKAAAQAWQQDKAPRLGASLAYYTVFSLAPLLVVIIGILGLVARNGHVQSQIISQVQSTVGADGAHLVSQMLQGISHPSGNITAIVVGVATTLLGAIGIFSQLKDALNTVLHVEPPAGRGLGGALKTYLLSFIMLLAVCLLLFITLVVSAGITGLSTLLAQSFAIPLLVWHGIDILVSLALTSLLFAILLKELPDALLTWNRVWPSALLTAVLFTLGKAGLAVYLGRSGLTSAYGAAGALVIILVWVYYSAQILLFGAEYLKVTALANTVPPPKEPGSGTAGGRLAAIFLIVLAFFLGRRRKVQP